MDSMGAGARDAYGRSEEQDKGARMRDLVTKHLDRKQQKDGEVLATEQRFFEQAAEEAYGAAIVSEGSL